MLDPLLIITNRYVNNNSILVKLSTILGGFLGGTYYIIKITDKDLISDKIDFVKKNKYINKEDINNNLGKIKINICGFEIDNIIEEKLPKLMTDEEIKIYIDEKKSEIMKNENIFDIDGFPRILQFGISIFMGSFTGSIISKYPQISVPLLVINIAYNKYKK